MVAERIASTVAVERACTGVLRGSRAEKRSEANANSKPEASFINTLEAECV
jgi:hypothetical protein